MNFAIDILGDTPKQKWENAIDLYCIVIGANIDAARKDAGRESAERLDSAKSVLKDFGDEMKRLAECVYSERRACG